MKIKPIILLLMLFGVPQTPEGQNNHPVVPNMKKTIKRTFFGLTGLFVLFIIFVIINQHYLISDKHIKVAKNIVLSSNLIKAEYGNIEKIDFLESGSKATFISKPSLENVSKIYSYNFNISGEKKSGVVKVILKLNPSNEIIRHEIIDVPTINKNVIIKDIKQLINKKSINSKP